MTNAPIVDVLAHIVGFLRRVGALNDMWFDAPEARQERDELAEEQFRLTAP